jgi:HupH hydrogenase expression protein, C-terminal conserved region
VDQSFPFKVTVEPNGYGDRYVTGNVLPLLNEIRHALKQLVETGETSTIDLRGIPMAQGEEDYLMEQLGEGEVSAVISAMGPSEVLETRFPGVWLVTHYNADDEIVGRFIEITSMPVILKSQQDDMSDALAHLDEMFKDEKQHYQA